MTKKNPDWTRDEHLLVLDLYLSSRPQIPSKTSREVREMSTLIRSLNEKLGRTGDHKFRNENGIYKKLMNFRASDPGYKGKGLSHRNGDEQVVWDLFSNDPEKLKRIVIQIKSSIDTEFDLTNPYEEELEEEESEEGKVLSRLHRVRERDPELVKKKKKQFLKANGRLFCEVCGFDFQEKYGERGEGFIECHHTQFLSERDESNKTRLVDLVLVCSNCHRIIHRRKPWLTDSQLRSLIKKG
ncbi:HNH endonuclease [Nitrospina gracilis]|uniref:HNH endonuclease n=1 Tax=Nitrospina gracilis TaxID=35801 RepID=UPI001F001E23|nr:HNH endonuclease [Nitrospina gracilis]MCF8719809.1 5-methylcytosine-specific restriction protein A [Nitrospina gracilis Nb-211]